VLVLSLLVLLALSVFDLVSLSARVMPAASLRTAFFLRAWMPFFFEHLLVAVTVATVLTFSLVLNPYDLGGSGRLIRAARLIVVVIIALGVLHGLWIGVLGPSVRHRLARIEAQSSMIRAVGDREAIERDREAGRLLPALERARVYRSLAGEVVFEDGTTLDDVIREIESQIVADAQRERIANILGEPQPEVRRVREERDLTISDLITRARAFFEDGNYYSAHYFATLAVARSDGQRLDARRIQAEALNEIESGARERADAVDQEFFRDKQRAYTLLQRGDDDVRALFESYYLFQDLERRDPRDPDVQRFGTVAAERVADVSFFVETARSYQIVPGYTDLVFFNRRTPEFDELIVVGSIVELGTRPEEVAAALDTGGALSVSALPDPPAGDLFYNIEVLRRYRDGDRILHFEVPYGMLINGVLVLQAIQREDQGVGLAGNVIGPALVEGSEGDLPGTIPLSYSIPEILRLSGGTAAREYLSIVELARAPALLSAIGERAEDAIADLVRRLVRLGGFFVVSLYALALSWRLRSFYLGVPPIPVMLAVPALPWGIWWALGIARYLIGRLTAELVPADDLVLTLAVVAGLIVLGLLGSITALAREPVEH
jgi:hypothetical protein